MRKNITNSGGKNNNKLILRFNIKKLFLSHICFSKPNLS